jgi:tetratricopeptide (TPR) repeat protein
MSGWSKAWLPEIAIVRERGTWFPIRQHFGVRAFGVNAWGADEGQELIGEHDELGPTAQQHEELYAVLSGHAKFTVDGEEVDAPAGTLVFVPDPASKRGAVAIEDGTTVLVAGAKPGEPFNVGVWEYNARGLPFFDSKEYDKAEEVLNEGLAEHPDHPGLLYNLACIRSLTGKSDEAIDLLQRSVQGDARYAEFAVSDSDFDAIREHPRFVEVTK